MSNKFTNEELMQLLASAERGREEAKRGREEAEQILQEATGSLSLPAVLKLRHELTSHPKVVYRNDQEWIPTIAASSKRLYPSNLRHWTDFRSR